MNRITLIVLAGSTILHAQAPSPVKTAKPPAISDALKAQFFKAQAQLIQANQEFQARQKALSDVVQSLSKACGESFQVQLDQQQDPVCQPSNPPAPKTP